MIRHADCLSLRTLFDRHYRPRKLLGRSEKNTYQYGVQLNHFTRFLGREPTLHDLTDETLCELLDWFHRGVDRGLRMRSPATVNKMRAHIVALWTFAADVGLVSLRPTVLDLPEPDNPPTAWTLEELGRLFAACRRQTGTIAGVSAAGWWTAAHCFWWDGGERTSATLALRWDWVSLDAGRIVIPGGNRKASKLATYEMSPETVSAFRAIIHPKRQLVFPRPPHRPSLGQQFF